MIKIKEKIYKILKGVFEGKINPFNVNIEELLSEIKTANENEILEILELIKALNIIHDAELFELSRILFDLSRKYEIYINPPFSLGELALNMEALAESFSSVGRMQRKLTRSYGAPEVHEEAYLREEGEIDVSEVLGKEEVGLIEEEAKKLIEEIKSRELNIYSYLRKAKDAEELALKIITLLDLLSRGEVEVDEYSEKIKSAE